MSIKTRSQDRGFINGLASYIDESGKAKTLYYGFYKNQVSLFLYDLKVGDYTLISGKFVFNRRSMPISLQAKKKIIVE